MKTFRTCLLAGLLAGTCAHAAEIQLYETGPAEDSSFIRFVNGSAQPLEVAASGAKGSLKLEPAQPVSAFLPIRAGTPLQGTLIQGATRREVAVTVEPGEFASVIGVPRGADGLEVVTIREQPDDFSAVKASVAFYSADPACQDASLLAAGRDIAIFEKVAAGQSARRQVNPVPLAVQLACAGQAVGEPLDLGVLEAGQRYTVFLLPAGASSKLVRATDDLAR